MLPVAKPTVGQGRLEGRSGCRTDNQRSEPVRFTLRRSGRGLIYSHRRRINFRWTEACPVGASSSYPLSVDFRPAADPSSGGGFGRTMTSCPVRWERSAMPALPQKQADSATWLEAAPIEIMRPRGESIWPTRDYRPRFAEWSKKGSESNMGHTVYQTCQDSCAAR
jgi:hypothetical protein